MVLFKQLNTIKSTYVKLFKIINKSR